MYGFKYRILKNFKKVLTRHAMRGIIKTVQRKGVVKLGKKKRGSTKSEINLTELLISGLIDLIVGIVTALIIKWL